MGKNRNTKRALLSLYLFVLIFQPNVIPVNTIYIFGVLTFFLTAIENKGKISFDVMEKSGMLDLYKVFLFLALYVVFVSAIDLVLGGVTVYDNRFRCLNQLIILPGVEFVGINFLFRKCNKYGFDYQDMIYMLAIVGAMQGLCSVAAYLVPQLRAFFLEYNGEIYKQDYVFERRGYGFSNILLDTYGYCMGLIAGAILLSRNIKVWQKCIVIPLCLISIVLNARTGIVVFAIAVAIYLFQSNTLPKFILKSGFATLALYLLWRYALPAVLHRLLSSSNITINWVGQGLQDFLNIINRNTSLNDAITLSSFSHYPESPLTLLLGAGHNVYGIPQAIGFHSDVGFINYMWEFGIFGTVIMAFALIRIYVKCFKLAVSKEKFIVIFLLISYIAVLFKGILLGYNPGVVVNYLLCFSIIYMTQRKDFVNY